MVKVIEDMSTCESNSGSGSCVWFENMQVCYNPTRV